MSHMIYQETSKRPRLLPTFLIATPTNWPERGERGNEIFVISETVWYVFDNWKEGEKSRKVSFYSCFFCKEECSNTVDTHHSLAEELGGKVNMECRIDQEKGSRRNTVHTFAYCFLTSSCGAAREWVQCEWIGSKQEQVMCVWGKIRRWRQTNEQKSMNYENK